MQAGLKLVLDLPELFTFHVMHTYVMCMSACPRVCMCAMHMPATGGSLELGYRDNESSCRCWDRNLRLLQGVASVLNQ